LTLTLELNIDNIGYRVKNILYIPPLTGKPEQQRFTMQSGVLTSISSRQRSAISGRPLPERTELVVE